MTLKPSKSLTQGLEAPQNAKGFKKEWARRIIVDYMVKTDPEWLLASVLKVIDVLAKENPHPGMLSDSYVADVSYCQSEDDLSVESWFVKVPRSEATGVMDQVEVFMYNKLFPLLQAYCSKATHMPDEIQMPIPLVFHCCYDEDNPKTNMLVMENLRDQGYKPLRPETCGLVFMRAAMRSLATVHAAAYAYQTALGGKASFLSRFPLVNEDNLPKARLIKDHVDSLLEPYLAYLGLVAPDIAPQIGFLKKFHKFILGVFHDIQKDKELQKLKILVHGDSKIDNFMFKKNPWSVEEEYVALIIDWQGTAYDLVSGDLMWALYGFLKNLPDKNSTVDTFVDYSIVYYHKELLRILKLLNVDLSKLGLPSHEYDATVLIKKGFIYEFLKTVLIKPILRLKGQEILINWFADQDNIPLPDEKDVFKSGTNFVNYIHLQITIATEIGVFHDFAPMCIQAMKEAMFGNINNLDDDETNADHDDTNDKTPDVIEQAEEQAKLDHETSTKDEDDVKSDGSGEVVTGIVYIKAHTDSHQDDHDKEQHLLVSSVVEVKAQTSESDAFDNNPKTCSKLDEPVDPTTNKPIDPTSEPNKPVNATANKPVDLSSEPADPDDQLVLSTDTKFVPVVPDKPVVTVNGQTKLVGREGQVDPTSPALVVCKKEELVNPVDNNTVEPVDPASHKTETEPVNHSTTTLNGLEQTRSLPPIPVSLPPKPPDLLLDPVNPSLTTTEDKPESGTKRKKKTFGKKIKKREAQKAIEDKIQELREDMKKTKTTLEELNRLLSENKDNSAVQLAVDELAKQVKNFFTTVTEELQQNVKK